MVVFVVIGLDVPNFIRGLDNNRIRCTKFYEKCTKFCEGCTKRSNVHLDMGIAPQSLPYRFPNEIMDPR